MGELRRGRKAAAKVELGERRVWFRDAVHGGSEMEKEVIWDWAEDGGGRRRGRRQNIPVTEKRRIVFDFCMWMV